MQSTNNIKATPTSIFTVQRLATYSNKVTSGVNGALYGRQIKINPSAIYMYMAVALVLQKGMNLKPNISKRVFLCQLSNS